MRIVGRILCGRSLLGAVQRVTTPGTQVSFVMPCYNEELVVGQTVRRLLAAFTQAQIRVELIAVDNGSRDRTGAILEELAREYPGVVRPTRVEVNVGYGAGILHGLPKCTSAWVGIIPADGQVDAADAVRLVEDAMACGIPVLAKARRRFRMDGPVRKVVSIVYNLIFRILYPGVESLDINGLPKVMPRTVVDRLELTSTRWFLDPEIMIKAHELGVRVLEYNVFARMRGNGLSHVRATTCWEFLASLLRYRTTPEFRSWRSRVRQANAAAAAPHEA